MPFLISVGAFFARIWGFFSAGGPLMALFIWIGKKLVMKFGMVQVQFTITALFFASKAFFFLSCLDLIRRLYNKFKELFDTLPSSISSVPSLDIPFKVLQSTRIIDAFVDAFSFFVLVFSSLLLIYIAKVASKALQQIKDDFHKMSMLMMA